jgi:Cu/Ag efflux protein CusF
MERMAWIVVLTSALVACSGAGGTTSYKTRGQVVELTGSGEAARASIAHEAIADFADREGKKSEMPAMTMAFGIGPGVDAEAFTPGSQWELSFDVAWGREPMLLITSARPLPATLPLALAKDR